jgi:RNA polymerase sigma-70 factor (ECF subfamily)
MYGPKTSFTERSEDIVYAASMASATPGCSELRRIPARTVAIDEIAEPKDHRAIAGGLEEEDRDRAVRRAVFALPVKYREVLILFYFHEMDVPTTARSLGLPEGTVKARLSRGRQMLRSKLSKRMGRELLGRET